MDCYPIIGIIGRAGVAASVEMVHRLEQVVTARGAFRDSHHPEVMLYQATQVPSRSMYLEERGESFIPGYIYVGKKLKAAGAGFLCMTCNTAHYAIKELRRGIGIEIVDMIEATLLHIGSQYDRGIRIGMMCSDGSRRAQLFERYFQDYDIIQPKRLFQEKLTQGICNVKRGYHATCGNLEESPQLLFTQVIDHLQQEMKADLVLLGCTEISVGYKRKQGSKVIDCLDMLVNACLARYQQLLRTR